MKYENTTSELINNNNGLHQRNEGEENLSSVVGSRCRLDTGEITLQVTNKHHEFCTNIKLKPEVNKEDNNIAGDNVSTGITGSTSQGCTDSDDDDNGGNNITEMGEGREAHEDEIVERMVISSVENGDDHNADDCAGSTISSLSEGSVSHRGHLGSSLQKIKLRKQYIENRERDLVELETIDKNSQLLLPMEITLADDSNSLEEWNQYDEPTPVNKEEAIVDLSHSSLIPLALETGLPENNLPTEFPIPTTKLPSKSFIGRFRTFSADATHNIFKQFDNTDHLRHKKNDESADYTQRNDDGDCITPPLQVISDASILNQYDDAGHIKGQRNDDGGCITALPTLEDFLATQTVEESPSGQEIEEVNGEHSVTVGRRPRRKHHHRSGSTNSIINIGTLVGQSTMSTNNPSSPFCASSSPCDAAGDDLSEVSGIDNNDATNEINATKIEKDFITSNTKKKSGLHKDVKYYWTRIKKCFKCCFKKEKMELKRANGYLS